MVGSLFLCLGRMPVSPHYSATLSSIDQQSVYLPPITGDTRKGSLYQTREGDNMLGMILIVILILALFGALPRWSHSKDWGYAPTGGLGLILIIVVILLLLGRI